MIDLHAHVLPGLDDGPASADEALELLRQLVEEGVEIVAATPHVRDDFPTSAGQIRTGVDALRRETARAGLPIEILPGAEVALDRLRFAVDDGSLAAFALAGNPHYLLVETPYYGWPLDLPDIVDALVRSGVSPVLAHPERNPSAQDDLGLVERLVEGGALVQITASSLTGDNGSRARRAAFALLERELAHVAASDVHGAGVRRSGLSVVRQTIADPSLVEWLTSLVPGAIVHDGELPPRPQTGTLGRRRISGLFAKRKRPRETPT